MSDNIIEIKKLLKEDKLVIGAKETMKLLRLGQLSKIYMAKNCPEDLSEDFLYHADLAGIEVVSLEVFNDELGDVCKKSFAISVIGLVK